MVHVSRRSRVQERTPLRLGERRKRRRIILTMLGVILLGGLLGGIVYASFRPEFAIAGIDVRGAETIGTQNVQEAVLHILNDGKFHFLSQKTVLTYPRQHIEIDLKERFHRIATVKVSAGPIIEPHLLVTIVAREPYASWCAQDNPDTPMNCYLMDKNGYIFAPAGTDQVEKSTIYSGEFQSGEEALGHSYLSDNWKGIQAMVGELENSGRVVTIIRTVDEFDYEAILANGVILKLAYDRAPEDMVADLATALSAPALTNKESQLEYIDLRFEGRAYYKLKGQAETQ